jgi:hypothetical protein
MFPYRNRMLLSGAMLLVVAGALSAQERKPGKFENRALSAMSLAGQKVPILPITMILADPDVEPDSLYAPWRERSGARRRGDSLIVLELQNRGPEVNWLTPQELRKMARRAPGMLNSPDELGQAMLRSERLEKVPDQLGAQLRKLVAIAGGRMVLVPAALSFSHGPEGLFRADLALVLVDTRRNEIVWRSGAVGQGASPDIALRSALLTVFPQ